MINIPWIFNEDAALKFKLQGLTVTDVTSPTGGRPVQVRFRLPENEVATLSYPAIIIEHASITPGLERAHRGYIQVPYAPEGYPAWWGPNDTAYDPQVSPYYSYYPEPVNFDYEITLYSRLSHFHMMPLVNRLSQIDKLPPQFGKIEVPQDHSYRTMIVTGGPEFGYGNDQDGKRRYWVAWKVRVFSELFLAPIQQLGVDLFPVTQLNFDLGVYEDGTDLTLLELQESFGILSVGSPHFIWNVNVPQVPPGEEASFPAQHIHRSIPKVPHRSPRRSY